MVAFAIVPHRAREASTNRKADGNRGAETIPAQQHPRGLRPQTGWPVRDEGNHGQGHPTGRGGGETRDILKFKQKEK